MRNSNTPPNRNLTHRLWCLLILFTVVAPSHGEQLTPITFVNARVFDGENVIPKASVRIEKGKIVKVNEGLVPVADSKSVNCEGMTLMPGLIDCHTHVFFRPQLVQAVQFGVTTELDMMSAPRMTQPLRDEQSDGDVEDRADFFSAGCPVTVEGGHGTQFGMPVPTLGKAEDADAFVQARVDEGADYLKIIYEDGEAIGMSMPTVTPEMVNAAVKAAHARKKIAVSHLSSLASAEHLLDAKINGFVHLFADDVVPDAFVKRAVQSKLFVVPTTTVISGVCGVPVGELHTKDESLAAFLTAMDKSFVARRFPKREMPTTVDKLKANIRKLHEAGVPILAGTDAPNPGTTHGASMHVELELLVDAGLSTKDALAAATLLPAKHFGLDDRGRIAVGLNADLLLVKGNPIEDITATRRIEGVWKSGVKVDREELRERVARQLADEDG